MRGLNKGSQPVFTRVSEETTENSERLGRQARSRNEPGTSLLAVFERKHWWGQGRTARHPCLTLDSNPEPLVQQPTSLTTSPPVGHILRKNFIWFLLLFNQILCHIKIHQKKKRNSVIYKNLQNGPPKSGDNRLWLIGPSLIKPYFRQRK